VEFLDSNDLKEDSQRQFLEEVFPAELEEIRQRRETIGLDAAGLEGPPSAEIGLVGLALSGGGIRSATFSLGVIEALANTGLLKRADYLSTVSGGGYIGSCLSSVLNDPDKEPQGRKFPFHHELGVEEPAAYRHLRNGSNYLAPRGILNKLRLPTLVLRGMLLNFLLFLPLVMLAVEITELAYEFGSHSPFDLRLVPFIALSGFLFLVLVFPLVARVLRRRMDWLKRDRYEWLLTLVFGVVLLLVIWLPISLFIGGAAQLTWQNLEQATLSEINTPLESRDTWKWIVAILVLGAFLFVGRASEHVGKWSGKFLLYMVGLIGPLVLFLIYLLLLVYQLDSPFIDKRFVMELDRGELTTELRETLASRGVTLSAAAQVTVEKKGVWNIRDGGEDNRITERRRFLRIESLHLWDGTNDVIFFTVWAGLLFFNLFFVDVNVTSPHGFYRDRLTRVFMFRVGKDGAVVPNDGQKLSDLNRSGTAAPYQLVNTSLNLHGSKDPNLRGRNADFFLFSKRYTGSARTGYCKTAELEEYDSHLNLGTAMAISGAAAAPNMGVTTVRSLVFIMTLLNLRLGYWLPHPAVVRQHSRLSQLLLFLRGPGPMHLLRESIGGLNVRGSHVNVSDGGHLENLGIYELLRRRCSYIVSVDGGADPTHRFGSLVELIRFAKIDMGVKIEIDLSDLEKDKNGLSRKHWALGTIRYGENQTGQLLYIKASITGDENLYVRDYAEHNPLFPHQSTANQFFTETQFESYRALGFHAARRAIAEHPELTEVVEQQPAVADSA